MSKFAVVKIKGHQYKVTEGEEFVVDKMDSEKPEADVLLVVSGTSVKVGTPTVKGAKVKLKVVEQEFKGEKLYVKKFKAKSRYRRKIGFRPKHTKLQVVNIS